MPKALFVSGDMSRGAPGWAASLSDAENTALRAEIARLRDLARMGQTAMPDVSLDVDSRRGIPDDEFAMLGGGALEGASSP